MLKPSLCHRFLWALSPSSFRPYSHISRSFAFSRSQSSSAPSPRSRPSSSSSSSSRPVVHQLDGFKALRIPSHLWTRLVPMGFEGPTPIQQAAIPLLMEGKKDVIIHDTTGSGKTLAYLLPICSELDNYSDHLQAIVVVPTEALAHQVYSIAKELWGKGKRDRAAHPLRMLCVPEELAVIPPSLSVQSLNAYRTLSKKKNRGRTSVQAPHILFGTPLDVLKALRENRWETRHLKFLVFDEIDRLLLEEEIVYTLLRLRDKKAAENQELALQQQKELSEKNLGNSISSSSKIKESDTEGKKAQAVFVSATITRSVRDMCEKFHLNVTTAAPETHALPRQEGPNRVDCCLLPQHIRHYLVVERFDKKLSRGRQKIELLLKMLKAIREQSRPDDHPVHSIMVFFSMEDQVSKQLKRDIEALGMSVARLCNWESNANRIGALRLKATHSLKGKMLRVASRRIKTDVLLCSDDYARGMDIKGVSHVINFDLPKDSYSYLHRAGRVGRLSSKDGFASTVITILNKGKLPKLERIQERLQLPLIQELRFHEGRLRLPGRADRFDLVKSFDLLKKSIPKKKYVPPPPRNKNPHKPPIDFGQLGVDREGVQNLFDYGTRGKRKAKPSPSRHTSALERAQQLTM